ncbi:hypothetical protein [Dictyobacter kobayashii]|uniref:Uncharacterized protein n=1 Tax=Dictyobacter kobayashii TaxID=2014872 RepID=A0A402AZA3_9CHLR|nr:hypothetical protein [Dictyobacter kobayashii]GCE24449.1 hypothetical protein KDK_82490 [Dictyobacter kobayashii]
MPERIDIVALVKYLLETHTDWPTINMGPVKEVLIVYANRKNLQNMLELLIGHLQPADPLQLELLGMPDRVEIRLMGVLRNGMTLFPRALDRDVLLFKAQELQGSIDLPTATSSGTIRVIWSVPVA